MKARIYWNEADCTWRYRFPADGSTPDGYWQTGRQVTFMELISAINVAYHEGRLLQCGMKVSA